MALIPVDLVKFNDVLKRCNLKNTTKSLENWLVKEIDDTFYPLFDAFSRSRIKSLLGVTGNFLRFDKCLLIVTVKYFLIALTKILPVWNNKIMSGDNIDFSIVMSRFSGIFEQNESLFISFLRTQRVKDKLSTLMSNRNADEFYNNNTILEIEVFALEFISIAENLRAIRILEIADQPLPEDIPNVVPQIEGIEEVNLRILYDKVCDIAINHFPSVLSDMMFLERAKSEFNKTESISEDNMKISIFKLIMYTYSRHDKNFNHEILYRSSSFATYKEEFNSLSWTAKSNPSYVESVSKIAKKIFSLLNQTTPDNLKVLNERIDSLKNMIGFCYGIKFLSFKDKHTLLSELKSKSNGKLVYKIDNLRSIYLDLFKRHFTGNKSVLEETILRCNPHCIRNAISYGLEENLMECHQSILFIKEGGSIVTGFDISELAMIILSAEGRNEHMGLPDFPEKGKIWEDGTILFDILLKIYSLNDSLYTDDEQVQAALSDINNGAKAMTNKNILEMVNELKSISLQSLASSFTSESVKIFKKLFNEEEETLNKHFGFIAICYIIHKANSNKQKEFAMLLKDINILHLIGYLGWIMLSDKVSSYSQEADDFVVTNKCKDIFERYILRLLEDNDEILEEKYYYYNNNIKYNEYFNKSELIDKLQNLQIGGQTLQSVLNSADCLHAIGGKLIHIYLTTLEELYNVVKYGVVSKDTIPFYTISERLKPLGIFKKIADDRYIYCVKHIGERVIDLLANENDGLLQPFDNINDRYEHEYSVQEICTSSKTRFWAGRLTRGLSNKNTNMHVIPKFYKYRLYSNEYKIVYEYNVSVPVKSFFKTNKAEVEELLRSTDLFMQHRIEHFAIYTRYIVDFSNMLHQYYETGLIDQNGQFIAEMMDSTVYPYNFDYPDYNDEQQGTVQEKKEQLKNYLYAYHLNYMYSDHEDIIRDFQDNFNNHSNINSFVARDFDSSGNQKSELVYFHDTIGKSSEIFDRDVRKGNKTLFGILSKSKNGINYGNLLVDYLKHDSETKEIYKFQSFNEMLIAKSMVSRVLLKVINPNFINPFYLHIMENETGEDYEKFVVNAKRSAVDKFCDYLNLNRLEPKNKNTDSIDELMLCYLTGIVYYAFLDSIVQDLILPPMLHMDDFQLVKNAINQNFFVQQKPDNLKQFLETYISNTDTSTATSEFRKNLLTEIDKNIKTIYNGLFKFMSLFFDPRNASTYNYNIVNIMSLKPLLDDITSKLNNYSEGIKYFSSIAYQNAENSDEIRSFCDIYCNGKGKFFPSIDNDISYISNPSVFMSEMVDIAQKYELLQTLTMPLSALNTVFDQISKIDTTTYDDMKMRLDIHNYNNFSEVIDDLDAGTFYQDVIDKPVLVNKINGLNDLESLDKIRSLFTNIIKSVTYTRPIITSIICISAYENAALYNQ